MKYLFHCECSNIWLSQSDEDPTDEKARVRQCSVCGKRIEGKKP